MHALARVGLDGAVTIHPLPTPRARPVGIAAAPDALWVAEIAAGQIARVDLAGHIREFPLTDRAARPHAIVADPEGGGAWFTEWATGRVGFITTAGALHHVALPAASEPHGLTTGADGALWIALETGHVARVEPSTLRRTVQASPAGSSPRQALPLRRESRRPDSNRGPLHYEASH